jgi:HAD superfamily hydrolase (TIGR01509 family)
VNSTRAVLFDLDGTLADTVPLIARHISDTLNAHGIACAPRDVYPLIGRPIVDAMHELHEFASDSERMQAVIVEYRAALHEAVNAAGTDLVLPGVRAMLRDLRDAGYGVGVVTAKGGAQAEHLLTSTELRDLVDVLVSTDDVDRGKPAPDSALLGLQRLGAVAEETWYVGDATSDMEMALAAGMRAMGITTGAATREELASAGAEVVVDSAGEVSRLLLG